VGELVEGAFDAEVGVEGKREEEGVGGQVAAGMIPDEERRALLGDVAQVANLAAEPEARQQPDGGQVLADVIGIAVVEVGGQCILDPGGERARQRPSGTGAGRGNRTGRVRKRAGRRAHALG
jgi:hypothetical protein